MIKKLLLIILIIPVFLSGCIKQKELTDNQLYSIIAETYSQDEINIKYPQIQGLNDDTKEKKINELIKNDFIETQIKPVDFSNGEILELELDYEVKMHTPEFLSVLYTGDSRYYTGYPDVKSSWRKPWDAQFTELIFLYPPESY